MGKGQIVSGGAGGLYSVRLVFNLARLISQIASLNAQIVLVDAKIALGINTSKFTTRIATLNTQIAALEVKINSETDLVKKKDLLAQKSTLQNTIIALTARAYVELERLKLSKTSIQKRIALMTAAITANTGIIVAARCADMTETLSGDIGTIEVPGERVNTLIQPGYGGNASYNAARDGMIQPALAATPESAFWNLAMLPGWQKWKPTYRFGTISNLNGNYCTVALETAYSRQQGRNVNQGLILNNVPISYKTEHGAAFTNGDAVVVKFLNQSFLTPQVIGFRNGPASSLGLLVSLSSVSGVYTYHVLNCSTGSLTQVAIADIGVYLANYTAASQGSLVGFNAVNESVFTANSWPTGDSGNHVRRETVVNTPTSSTYTLYYDGIVVFTQVWQDESYGWSAVDTLYPIKTGGNSWEGWTYSVETHGNVVTWGACTRVVSRSITVSYDLVAYFYNGSEILTVPFGSLSVSESGESSETYAGASQDYGWYYGRPYRAEIDNSASGTFYYWAFPYYIHNFVPSLKEEDLIVNESRTPNPEWSGVFNDLGVVFVDGAKGSRSVRFGGAALYQADPRTLPIHAALTSAVNNADTLEFSFYRRT